MGYTIKNVISNKYVPQWGNQKKFIAIHYLGVVGQNHELQADGCGAHFYIYWDGTIYQRCSLDAIVWAVGTAGYYTQKHPQARNANTISIEMCCKCDGDSTSAEDKKWYFTTETQEACAWLVKKLMKEQGIPAENVLRHYDIVNKTCPAPYVHNNKYKTSWTWDEFKAKISGSASGGSGTTNGADIKNIQIGDSTVNEISKVVYNEAGVIQSHDALVAVAQCIKDMADNGGYGEGITDVMERNFSAYGQVATTDDARRAVYEVFVEGKRRFNDAVILQFRSFTKYSDGKGNMDRQKCAALLGKYEYLGKDARDNRWGHFYFGHKTAAPEPAPTKNSYVVQAGSFSVKANATKRMSAIKKAGFDAIVKQEGGQYKVQCGVFEVKANANALVAKLKAAGFEAIIKTV